jgi:hypothetical protein
VAYDEIIAATLSERLAVMRTIDSSAELSFLQSAEFRLELFNIVHRSDGRDPNPSEILASLVDLHQRVRAVIAASS